MVLHKCSPQVLEASSSDLSLSSLFILSFCLFVCILLFSRYSEHATYNDFVVSIQCIVCMSYNVYRFLLLPFFQLLLCFCALIWAVAAAK